MTHAAMSAEARATAGISDGLLRLSIGIEHPSDLCADLERALERVRPRFEKEFDHLELIAVDGIVQNLVLVVARRVLMGEFGCLCHNAAHLFDVPPLGSCAEKDVPFEPIIARGSVVVQCLFDHV